MGSMGRILVGFGLVALIVGGLLMLLSRAGVTSLPGDMRFGRGNWRFYFPLGTSILISLVLTLLLNLFIRRR